MPATVPSAAVKIPLKYLDLTDVFDKGNMDILTLHQRCDHLIDLHTRAKISFDYIHALAEPALQALYTYLQENLQNWFICPATSLASAPIFFVKKDGFEKPCIDY